MIHFTVVIKSPNSFLDPSFDHYVIEANKYKDTKECTTGVIINDTDTCIEACKELGIPIEYVKGGSPCIKTQSGECRQDGAKSFAEKPRKLASLICKVSGGYRFFIVKYSLT